MGFKLKSFKRKPIIFRGSKYTPNRTYLMLLTPMAIQRTVEARGRERNELYYIGRIREYEKPKESLDALEAFTDINGNPTNILKTFMVSEDLMAIYIPRSIFSQLVANLSEEAIEALEEGKAMLALAVQVNSAKRGNKTVRNYSIMELRVIFLEHPFNEEMATKGYSLYNPELREKIREIYDKALKALGVNGEEEKEEEEGGE